MTLLPCPFNDLDSQVQTLAAAALESQAFGRFAAVQGPEPSGASAASALAAGEASKHSTRGGEALVAELGADALPDALAQAAKCAPDRRPCVRRKTP